MKKIEYRTYDKSTWGPGPWQEEPDKVQWVDEATGLPCLAVRGPKFSGHWCGYVGVPEGHRMFGKHHDVADAISVHGGLTFASACDSGPEDSSICHLPEPGEPDHVWWFGFDCAHAGDFGPGQFASDSPIGKEFRELMDRGRPTGWGGVIEYRDLAYVQAECANLARQLSEIQNAKG